MANQDCMQDVSRPQQPNYRVPPREKPTDRSHERPDASKAWLAFFLRGVIEVSTQAADTARQILLLREDHRKAITERFGRAAGNGHRVLEHLYEHPMISVRDVQELIGSTYPAANDLVVRLVESGILGELIGRARNRRFLYSQYVRLFSETDQKV